ncbi:MAG: paraquat-inducible protein A [Pseudomonadales bacterium]
MALLLTATLLYFPANLYPIMITDQLGNSQESTIMGGVLLLIRMGSLPVAAVIFIASVIVPLGKMLSLYYLVWGAKFPPEKGHRHRTALYRLTELIGKWSMIDVFVVSILVALVHLGGLLVIRPGIAALSFAGVVILTILAAESLDPRLIWDRLDQNNE